MTVIYDAKDHIHVIFSLHGSVWPSVLPWCIFNAVVASIVWLLRYYDIYDLTINGGLGYQYISVLVSFFVVSSVNTAYNRFWEARNHLGNLLAAAAQLGARVALYSGRQMDNKANMWRNVIKIRIIDLLRSVAWMLENERSALFNVMDRTGSLDVSDENVRDENKAILSDTLADMRKKTVMSKAFKVEAAIRSHADYIDPPLLIHHEMDLLSSVTAFKGAYSGLLKFSTTPRPFPIVQMGRTLVFLWVLSLPFALSKDSAEENNILECLFLVILVTYGFIGLMEADIELHDPLGTDANDIETERYTKIVEEGVKKFLDDGAAIADAFDLERRGVYDSFV